MSMRYPQIGSIPHNQIGIDKFRCFTPENPYFAYLTLLSMYLPGPHVTTLVFNKRSACLLNIVWGVIFTGIGSVAIALWNFEIFDTRHNNYDLVFVLAPTGLYCIVCGLGTVSLLKFKQSSEVSDELKTPLKIFLQSLLFPFVFFLSPLLGLVVAFRGIFPHNADFRCALLEFKFIECVTETSTQLCLQFFIVLTNFPLPPSNTQLQSIFFGVFTVAIPAMEKFLESNKPYSFFNYVKYYPIFFFNVVFRILTWSIIFMYFYFFYGVVIFICHIGLLASMNYFVMTQFYPEMIKEKHNYVDYKSQLGEMAIQNFLTIPNLMDTKAARFCRKFSFYACLVINISVLLMLVILCNLGIEIEIDCRPLFGDCIHDPLNDDPIIHEIKNFNMIVTFIISIGILGMTTDHYKS